MNINKKKTCNGNPPVSFMYQNVTGLPTKTKGISECLLTKNNILIKTKSSSEILTSELGICQLNVYINDRSPLTSIKKSGGGLLSVGQIKPFC